MYKVENKLYKNSVEYNEYPAYDMDFVPLHYNTKHHKETRMYEVAFVICKH